MKTYSIIIGLMLFGFSLNAQVDESSIALKEAIIGNVISDQKPLATAIQPSYSDVTYKYYQLMLKLLPSKAILITNGLNDTYPVKITQILNQVRPDVNVICMSWLSDDKYRTAIDQKLAIGLSGKKPSEYLETILASGRAVYISATVNKQLWNRSNMYLNGLTFGQNLSNQRQDLLQFLNTLKSSNLVGLSWSTYDANLCRNILPPLLTLYKLKFHNNQSELKQMIQTIAKKTNQEKKVNDILKKYG